MKRKDEIGGKIADELQMPRSAVSSVYRIEFRGNEDVTVEGCKGIVEYDNSVISLNLGSVVARFRGSDLEISSFFEEQAVIRGVIIQLEFST
ncbi:MAG: YabP/YqfC family sporulation protein [Clostridiales bacterium]|nr:YabP/YqfC family sporulation protein [Clostridiales bacterium]